MASNTKAKTQSTAPTPPAPPAQKGAAKATAPAKSNAKKIKVVFNGDSRGLADCNINGQGHSYPVGTPVLVEKAVADVIGNYALVGGDANE